jgi:hypothetical protein
VLYAHIANIFMNVKGIAWSMGHGAWRKGGKREDYFELRIDERFKVQGSRCRAR